MRFPIFSNAKFAYINFFLFRRLSFCYSIRIPLIVLISREEENV